MDWGTITANLFNPPILCFFLGVFACLAKSDLDFPAPLPKFFSYYLLFAIGFKGGVGLAASGLNTEALTAIGLCILLSLLVPIYSFFILKKRAGVPDAAAIAATYGSISAVTFITASAYLDREGVLYGSHMVAAMALMESPAIIIGVLLARKYANEITSESTAAEKDAHALSIKERMPWGEIMRDAFLNGSVIILLGMMLIGFITGERGMHQLEPFTHKIFYGMLCLFLLDMGIVSARRLESLRQVGLPLLAFTILSPLFNAAVAIACTLGLNLPTGDSLLVVVLAASASYIAVPAAMRIAVPEAKASIYLPMSLAVTFPFNIIIGIPLYYELLNRFS